MEDCSGTALFAAHDRMRETFKRTGSAAAAHAAELARYEDNEEDDDDPLITCEVCGQDILQSTAYWHEATETDGCVPLCRECHSWSPTLDEPEDDEDEPETKGAALLALLRYHVSGAIERGEGEAIVECLPEPEATREEALQLTKRQMDELLDTIRQVGAENARGTEPMRTMSCANMIGIALLRALGNDRGNLLRDEWQANAPRYDWGGST